MMSQTLHATYLVCEAPAADGLTALCSSEETRRETVSSSTELSEMRARPAVAQSE